MSSSGLIYAVIVGAWAAYLVPMWLRRQDELNEARPTERFSTAIRLLSGRAGMERRYAKDLQARSPEDGESRDDPDGVTGSVDVRSFVAPASGTELRADRAPEREPEREHEPEREREAAPAARARVSAASQAKPHQAKSQAKSPVQAPGQASVQASAAGPATGSSKAPGRAATPAQRAASAEAAARARRSKVLARRRRTTVLLFLAFTVGAIVAGVGGLAFLWAPAAPAVLLSAYIVYLRGQERRRFTYTMDRRRAEVAAQRLRERQPRRRPAGAEQPVDETADEGPGPETETGLSALAADRRALVEQTDHAEWVDQQRERQRGPGRGDSWDPVPVPLPTYVTAPVAPRATGSVDLSSPDTWSAARSSTAEGSAERAAERELPAERADDIDGAEGADAGGGRSDRRRAASARRARERGRTPLFDQYEDGGRPRAANE
ncbi:gephyrin-like molybdotransferase receptor GlpR [Streptomyces sp. NPDC005863]|uniref:gephyrin-like molybdotransferase receptor GlpR n=1 Tax=unclassified Streptomyces TaxID=2593676 RepID=UPI0033EAB479